MFCNKNYWKSLKKKYVCILNCFFKYIFPFLLVNDKRSKNGLCIDKKKYNHDRILSFFFLYIKVFLQKSKGFKWAFHALCVKKKKHCKIALILADEEELRNNGPVVAGWGTWWSMTRKTGINGPVSTASQQDFWTSTRPLF